MWWRDTLGFRALEREWKRARTSIYTSGRSWIDPKGAQPVIADEEENETLNMAISSSVAQVESKSHLWSILA